MRLEEIPDFAKKYWTFCTLKGLESKVELKQNANIFERLFWKNHCGVPMVKVKVRVTDSETDGCGCDSCIEEYYSTWQDMWVCSYDGCIYAEHPSGYAGGL